MKRQKLRKLLITASMLLFPVTLYYFSPALIINSGLNGVINGSFIVFVLMMVLSIPFGRLFCAYLCPSGGIQECTYAINSRIPKQGWKNNIKYVIWIIWIAAVVFCYVQGDKTITVDFWFETTNGISVTNLQSYIIYYGIVILIFIPSVLFGKRVFCHYFCWMAPFMVIGTKIRQRLNLPGLHIRVKNKAQCTGCGKCSKNCPMGIDVKSIISEGEEIVKNNECIQCGECIDSCPKKVLGYRLR